MIDLNSPAASDVLVVIDRPTLLFLRLGVFLFVVIVGVNRKLHRLPVPDFRFHLKS